MKPYLIPARACVLLAVSACTAPSQPLTSPLTAVAEPFILDAGAKPIAESLTIKFAAGTAALSPDALAQLDGAGRLYRDAHPEVMLVAGHTDKTGQEYANLLLSARRADSVKRALIDRGVPAQRLQLIAYGEAEPAPPVTASRTVVVTWR